MGDVALEHNVKLKRKAKECMLEDKKIVTDASFFNANSLHLMYSSSLSSKELNANAQYNYGSGYLLVGSSACTVTVNNDNYDWHNVTITINGADGFKR